MPNPNKKKNKSTGSMLNMSIRLTPELNRAFDKIREREGNPSKSSLFRKAILSFIKKYPEEENIVLQK